MTKLISKILLVLFSITFLAIIYLSSVGIETNTFNKFIKSKVKDYNENIVLNFSKVKLLLDLKSFNLKIKLIEPKIVTKKASITFSDLNSIISLKSYLNNEFAIRKIKFKTNKIEIVDFINFARTTYPSPSIFILKSIVNGGKIEGETELSFNEKGEVQENYEIKGTILNLEAKLLNKYKLSKVNSNFIIKKDSFKFDIKDNKFLDLNFNSTNIHIIKSRKDYNFKIKFKNFGKINDIDEFFKNFNYKLPYDEITISNLDFNLENQINFNLKKIFKVRDFEIKGLGIINNLKLSSSNFKKLKKHVEIEKDIFFQNNKIEYHYSDNKLEFKNYGKINLKNEYENFKSNLKIDYKKNKKNIDINLDVNSLNISNESLNYNKPINKKSNLKAKLIIDENKTIINDLNFIESNTNILVKNIHLNNKNEILNFNEISINTFKNDSYNNNFKIIKKNDKINIIGKKYDATYFLKNINEDKKSKLLNEKFTSKINIKIDEVITDGDIVSNFKGKGKINLGKIKKLSAKGNFSENEFLEISITPIKLNKNKLYVYSDRAKPFINNYKFIKGFSDGKLEYTSNYDDKSSVSNLKILNFKVKDVPALAKLLSLASLQGIADLLTGEGIRFSEFEMDATTKDNLMTIDEIYAIGPAISILMSGYIEKNKLISLRGTLVPATTINKAIGSIPLIGKILVGSKTGEGVFGVSFKIKGPPKQLKTTVNPIKTLTPRFITRTLEKIKKNN